MYQNAIKIMVSTIIISLLIIYVVYLYNRLGAEIQKNKIYDKEVIRKNETIREQSDKICSLNFQVQTLKSNKRCYN